MDNISNAKQKAELPHDAPVIAKSNNLAEYARQQYEHETVMRSRPCKVCSDESVLFDVIDFSKRCDKSHTCMDVDIPVCYRRCNTCGFIGTCFFDNFTSEQWISFVYNSEY
jgi:hypothetical protein